MALHFYKKPMVISARTLKELVARYKEYTASVDYTSVDEEGYDKCCSTVALLQSALNQIREGRESLQKLHNEIVNEYKNCKNKSEKKDLMTEIEQIEVESKVHETVAEASELIFMLTARMDESTCARRRMAIKLGYTTHKSCNGDLRTPNEHELQDEQEDSEETSTGNYASGSQPHNSIGMANKQHRTKQLRSLKPPQASLPNFHGNVEEFAEYWSVFETLVHTSEELDTVEKIILLRESLKGRARAVIQGIQPLPENYEWMIKTLKQRYCDYAANRSQIVQKLMRLRGANESADSCLVVLEQVQVLVNQMVSAGYDVRNTCDPIWLETILAKFPHDIVKPVLVTSQADCDQTIENLLDNLKKEISAKSYVESRLGHTMIDKATTSKGTLRALRPIKSDGCIFCQRDNHSSLACRTITDKATRRKCLKEHARCWKCCSPNHSSFECQKPDCANCGEKHNITLCFKQESYPMKNRNQSRFPMHKNPTTNQSRPWIPRHNEDRRVSSQANNARFRATDSGRANERSLTNNTQTLSDQHIDDQRSSDLISSQLILMTAEGNIWNHRKGEFEKALFFFDSGAQKTVIQESYATDLGLPRSTTEICVMSGIGGHIEEFVSHSVEVTISTAFGEEMKLLFQTKPIITNGFPSVRLAPSDIVFLKEHNICLANTKLRGERQSPQILVGLDYFHELVTSPTCGTKTPTGLQISKTIFGPTVYGKGIVSTPNSNHPICYGLTAVCEQNENEMLQKMFELDGLGIADCESQQDERVHRYSEQYSKKLSFKGGYITAPFPLKSNVSDLEDNYSIAIRRLESLQNLLSKNTQQREWYCEVLKKYESEGMIETFSAKESDAVSIYYMPHSGVWKPSKKIPLRIVFDASSKRKGKLSLNDVIHKGETFVNKIHDILMASRSSSIILMCDIEAAFTQIRIQKSHKDLCRFLWLKNVNLPPTRDNLLHYRFKRLPFGITASPSILNMALTSFLHNKGTELSNEIAKNLYVDNIMLKACSVNEALSKYKSSKTLFTEIGMNLREYFSNNSDVNNAIPQVDRLDFNHLKILGVAYESERDRFKIATNFPRSLKLTKKDIVSQINSVYDPLGIVSPLLVRLKSMMREVFCTGIDWKGVLESEICDKWNKLCSEVHDAEVTVPRPITTASHGGIRLWVFADASKIAIAACAYAQDLLSGKISSLICGKSRLTPKKCRQTIPRLELVGLLMAVRLSSSIVSNMENTVDTISIVTDSEITLWWLKSSKKLPVFVSNTKERIQKVRATIEQRGTSVSFYHVDTSHNPADAGTRGLTKGSIYNHDWVNGPRWLENSSDTWPLKSIDSITETASELDIELPTIFEPIVGTAEAARFSLPIIDLKRFSNLNKALRVVSLVGKVLKKWVASTNTNRSQNISLATISDFSDSKEVTSDDYDLSERLVILQEQKGDKLEKLQQKFRDKALIRDKNGIIRHKSRLQNAEIPYDTKSPIYIPPMSDLIRLIVEQIHRENAHCGKEHTLTIARQRFWIPRPSNMFKKYLKNCATCRRYHGLPLGAPDMPDLPLDRVVAVRPFQNTGCDFLGPFTSNTQEKMYICLYTCLTTRCVHLEVVENLSTGAFLNSFTRFISRRGVPKIMRSDCGANFKQGEQIISAMFEKDEVSGHSVMTYCASKRIKWIFNPAAAPWMGGVWERLVGMVKMALSKAIGRKRLDFVQMSTVITMIEAILNTRPLTKLNMDDMTEVPLRPIDFLQRKLEFGLPVGERTSDINDTNYDPETIQSRQQAIEAMNNSEVIANKFWDSWRSNYLVNLREMQKQQLKQPRHMQRFCPEIGEVVLIEQDLIPRGAWPYGKITDVITSSDGFTRSARILMPNRKIIQRPLNKIYPLEIRSIPDNSTTEETLAHEDGPEQASEETVQDSRAETPEGSRTTRPRASKKRAYEFFRNMEANITYAKSSISKTSVMLIAVLSIISPVLANEFPPPIVCAGGVVYVPPTKGRYEICIDNECKLLHNTSGLLKYILPIIPTEKAAVVRLRSLGGEGLHDQTQVCERADFCEHQYLLSKSLLGNPHCWPIGAIATSAVLIYLLIIAAMCIIWTLTRISKHTSCCRRIDQDAPDRSKEPDVPSCSFQLTPLPAVALLSLCVSIIMIPPINSCQHGYMRHSAELMCNEKNRCHLTYSRELLFNKLQSELCIEIMHSNKTVGLVKFTKKHVDFKCMKAVEFFTRPTKLDIYHIKRCAQAGSCTTDTCETTNPNKTAPELTHASRYPGYSGCLSSCGGVLCGCLLPLPTCWFYRVVHKPTSRRVFEIARCIHWIPTIEVDVQLSIANVTKNFSNVFSPYVPKKMDNFTVTVISIQNPTHYLENRRYALSKYDSYILPPRFKVPVACSSSRQALNNFSACTNQIQCNCGNSVHSCQCPQDSIRTLQEHKENILPLETPFAKISMQSNTIIATTNEEEMVLRVESEFIQNSAELVVHQPCKLNLTELLGCYNCEFGAQLTAFCKSPSKATVTVTCEHRQFLLRCGPEDEKSIVNLVFDHPHIHELCYAHCSEHATMITLEGTLRYHITGPEVPVFQTESHGVPIKHQWFNDISLPNLEPLLRVIKQHWKLALTTLTATAILVALTYIAGPAILLVVMRSLLSLIVLLGTYGMQLIKSVLKTLFESSGNNNDRIEMH